MKEHRRHVWAYGLSGMGLLIVLAWGLLRWTEMGPDQLLAAYLAGYVETIPEALVEDELREMAVLDGPGLLALLAALDSARPAVARSATAVLDQQLATWRDWPSERASRQVGRLAAGLARRVDQWSPAARSVARDLALQILDWPVDRRHVDRAVILADCEYVLRSAWALPRAVAVPVPQDGSALGEPIGGPRELGGGLPATARDGQVAVAALRDTWPKNEPTECDVPASAADRSRPGADAEPQLLPDDSGSRAVRQRVGAEAAAEDAPPQMLATWAVATDSSSAPLQPETAVDGEADGSARGARPDHLPPELARMHDLNLPGAASTRAEQWLRERGFGDAELTAARLLVSPQASDRRKMLDTVTQMPRGGTRWLIWLSYDADAEVRQAAIALLVTSRAPHVARRLLELESSEPDPDIRRQLQAWRAAEAAGNGAAVPTSVAR